MLQLKVKKLFKLLVVFFSVFVIILSDFAYSNAEAASRPRVEQSQQSIAAEETIASAIVNRFFSPPEIPLINSFPTI